jgi:putative membrane protein
MHWDGNMGWMAIWWIVIIAAVVSVLWIALSSARRGGGEESPEKVLKRRYAQGEIDRETYERMLEDLRK